MARSLCSQCPPWQGVCVSPCFSTKSAHSNRPNLKKIKFFLLLSYHRVKRIRHQKSGCFFASNAHIRAFIEGRLFLKPANMQGVYPPFFWRVYPPLVRHLCGGFVWRELRTMNYQPPTTSYANRLSSPAHPEPVEGSLPVLSVVEGNYWQPATVYILLSNWALAPNPSPLTLVFCPRPFTTVEKPLQIRLFMQNKPKFRKSQMNVNKVLTKDYDKKTLGEHGKNKPNSNPIQSQSNPIKANLPKAQMNVNKVLTKDYENKLNWAICENKANSNPIQTQNEPNQTQFLSAISVAGQRQKNAAAFDD